MKKALFTAFLAFLFVGCSKSYWSDVKEGLGLKSDYDYSACEDLEKKTKDKSLPMEAREQAFKDLAQCRETAKSLQKEKK